MVIRLLYLNYISHSIYYIGNLYKVIIIDISILFNHLQIFFCHLVILLILLKKRVSLIKNLLILLL